MARSPAARRPELDALRVAVVVGLVLFHSALVFDAGDDFYVKNDQTTDATLVVAGLGVVWAMPTLFAVSGIGAWHSLHRRGPRGYLTERLLRIGVPFAVAMVTIVPVPQWLRLRAADPGFDTPYPQFLRAYFDVHLDLSDAPFVVRGEHFETGHLWFLVLLLTFSLLLVAAVALARRFTGSPIGRSTASLRERAVGATRRRGVVLAPALVLAAYCAAIGLEEGFAAWNRWAYLLFFLAGYALASDERLREAALRDRGRAWLAGGLLFLASSPVFLGAGDLGIDVLTDRAPLAAAARALFGAAGWCFVVAILGQLEAARSDAHAARPQQVGDGDDETPGTLPDDVAPAGRSRAGARARFLGYLAVGVLPLYVLHQPVVVSVAYGVVTWDLPALAKYVVIVLVSFAVTLALYDLARRTRFTRFLLGMR